MYDEELWGPRMIPAELDDATLGRYLDFWLVEDEIYLRAHPETPMLYDAGVRYIPEARGKEVWRAVPGVIANGGSVCHSLACWRAAELRVRGYDARPVWSEQILSDNTALYHVQVYAPGAPGTDENGIDDPSARLGMPGAAPRMRSPVQQVAVAPSPFLRLVHRAA